MKDKDSLRFIDALQNNDMETIVQIPKADLHNHFVLGGCRRYIKEMTGIEIPCCEGVLDSMEQMHQWNNSYIGDRFDSSSMRRLLIDAAFVQAKRDGITVLEIGEDVWGLGEYFNQDIKQLIDAFESARQRLAPDIRLRLQIGLSRHCPADYLLECLEHFWGHREFYSIDLYGDETAQPIENFVPVYRKAKENGLRLKAHIGEWGTALDIKKGVELLELDEVQHGIAAADSREVMEFLAKNRIRLNITPTSNIKLGRTKNLKDHPIGRLYRAGVDVTINSDDILIFDSDVSKEYVRLYQSGCLTAGELDNIRISGLKDI